MSSSIETQGYDLLPDLVPTSLIDELLAQLDEVPKAGKRSMLSNFMVSRLANSPRLLNAISPHLPASPLPVRAILFDKTPDDGHNWLVPWHQDLTICVREQKPVDDFGPWSLKDGLLHVQPPAGILEKMITVRVHLDDTDDTNGALRVLPGTHVLGRLNAQEIRRLRHQVPEITCIARRGDVLLMRPLLLHASSRSMSPRHRRILHIEYTGTPLPGELVWNDCA